MKKAVVAVVNPSMSNAMSQSTLVNPSTAFAVFDFPVMMTLDMGELDARYRRAQLMVHPDRFVGKSLFERKVATDQAIRLTEAYQTLKDPLLRGGEVLKAYGFSIPGKQGQTIQHPTLLMEVIAWREQLEDCQDSANLDVLEQYLQNEVQCQQDLFDEYCAGNTLDVDLPLIYLRFIYLIKTLQDLKTHSSRS